MPALDRKRELTDILIVAGVCSVLLLAVFATPYLYGFGHQAKAANLSRDTQKLINKIEIALSMYQKTVQSYPPGTHEKPGTLFKYLGQKVPVAGGKTIGPFIIFRFDELDESVKAPIVVDRWGHPIVFISDPAKVVHNKGGVDIFSLGPDGQTPPDAPGTGADDLNNWTPER